MAEYMIDFFLVSILVVGLTALMGPLTNGLGNWFSKKATRSKYVIQSDKSTAGFKPVGGKKTMNKI